MKVNNICRICFGKKVLINIFEDKDCIPISQKIMSVAKVVIKPDDSLPQKICFICLDRLNFSYQFKLDCELSDAKLRFCQLARQGDDKESEDNINPLDNKKGNLKSLSIPEKKPSRVSRKPVKILKSKVDGEIAKNIDCVNQNSIDKYAAVSEMQFVVHENLNTKDISNDKDLLKKRNKHHKPQQCFTCGKVMSSKYRLKLHMRIHTGERPYTCSFCSKKFSVLQNLKVHERVHTREKPLECKECGKKFAQSAALVAHERLHSGNKPYTCKLCPQKFCTAGHLKYHIKRHTGEKNFECDVCGRAFIARGDLAQHVGTHAARKPYVCAVCGQAVSRAQHLRRHMRTHSGRSTYQCEICKVSFTLEKTLQTHNAKQHQTQENEIDRGGSNNTPTCTAST